MKKYITFLFLVILVSGLISCDGFLTKDPTNKSTADRYFRNKDDLQLYANGLLNAGLPSFSSIAIGSDVWTDFCATKTGSDFYHPGLWSAERQISGWSYSSWSFMREVNYMLDNMEKAQANVDNVTYNHYVGVARFWRAYTHYGKVASFGNIPWIDHVVSEKDSLLHASRQDREFVMHKVMEDLNFAVDNCLDNSTYFTDGRTLINRWVALAMKARICLFEGSYRKYHPYNPSTGNPWNNKYETSEDFYRACISACEEIINGRVFSIHMSQDTSLAYNALFTSEIIPKDEVIWSRQASETESVKHGTTSLYNTPTAAQKYSPTKELVDMYLMRSGKPVETDKVSPTEEFENRDFRLSQTIMGPGHTWTKKNGALEPVAPNFTFVLTGYEFCKWNIEKEENYSSSRDVNSMPVLRYAEVLLNYAEAKAEMGEMTEDLWNKTVGLLRERGGVKNFFPGTAGYVKDEWLDHYYNDGQQQKLSDVLLEIRRERATELAMECSLRYDDLMRWHRGDLIVRRYNNRGWRGIYLTQSDVKNGWTFNYKKYTIGSSNSATSYPAGTSGADMTWSLSEGDHGYLIYNYELEWLDKMYLTPIPATAINNNPGLGQNYGWD